MFFWIGTKKFILISDEKEPATILIAKGEYHETVKITRQGPLTLLVRNARLAVLQFLPHLDHMDRANFLVIPSTHSNLLSPIHPKDHLNGTW